ncbi:MAG: hypothetical protein NT159_07070, partial [Proteobacteria bacterium]|nr:hypothetical protein [Pseudomonadota bacterium]
LYLSSIHSIQKLSPVGAWTTFAGNATVPGLDDDLGTAARFSQPNGLALDHTGNLFVADTGNATIRKISPDGRVSTVAGLAPQWERLVDAVGAAARFAGISALAANGSGQIYVADTGHRVVRRVTPDGTVTTLAGAVDSYGHADGIGSNARFYGPSSIALDSAGNVLAGDGTDLRTISPTGEVRTLAPDAGGGTVDALASSGDGTWLAVRHVMIAGAACWLAT